MSELSAIEKTGMFPSTIDSLKAELGNLGIRKGHLVLMHSSLSALGWVCGGAEAVILALLALLGEEGTLMVPTHTGGNTEPSRWKNPPVPEPWWEAIRASSPPFDSRTTPSRGMGVIAEVFRSFPGVVRSPHPIVSFVALGPCAEDLVSGHTIPSMLGEDSPVGGLYRLRGKILLLGTGYESCTALHLAEYRASFLSKRWLRESASVQQDGARKWAQFDMMELSDDDFESIGEAFERECPVAAGPVGSGKARLIECVRLIDFAVGWMERHR